MNDHGSHRWRRLGAIILWSAVLGLLWWSVSRVDLSDLSRVLNRLGPAQIALLLSLNAAIFLTFVARWWVAARGAGLSVPFTRLIRYRLAAFGITYFTPGPQFGGEPYQVFVLTRWHGAQLSTAVTAVSLDKLVELLANFTFLLLGIAVSLQLELVPAMQGLPTAVAAVALLAVPSVYLLGLNAGRAPLSRLMRWLEARFPHFLRLSQVRKTAVEVEDRTGRIFRERRGLVFATILISMLSWLGLILEYRLALSFLGLSLTWPETIGVLTAARIAFLLPVPSGLGTLEAGQILAMSALGLDPAFAISVSLLVRARDVLFGGLGLWWGGLLRVRGLRSLLSSPRWIRGVEDAN